MPTPSSWPSDERAAYGPNPAPDFNALNDITATLAILVLQLLGLSPGTAIPASNNANLTAMNGQVGSTVTALLSSLLGAANGVPRLDASALVQMANLPVGASMAVIPVSGTPSSTTGFNGDWALDTTTGNLWGPKSGGAWPGSAAGQIPGTLSGWTPAMGLLDATAYPGGYQLQSTGTPPFTILTWTAPSSGQHRVSLMGELIVAGGTEAGGQLNLNYTTPGGTAEAIAGVWAGGLVTGVNYPGQTARGLIVEAGSTVTLTQTSLQTGSGVTGTVFAELQGS